MLLAGPAEDDPACDEPWSSKCWTLKHVERLSRLEQPAAEDLAATGTEGVRIWFIDGYGRDMPSVAILKAPGAEPRLDVRDHQEGRTRRMSLDASSWTWRSAQTLMEVTENSVVERSYDPFTEVPAEDGSGETEVTICLHPWGVVIEAIQQGRVTRRFRSTCDDELLLEGSFALATRAVGDLPGCGFVDRSLFRNDAARLQGCFLIDGKEPWDAAAVLSRLLREVFAEPTEASSATLQSYFSAESNLTEEGRPPAIGPQALAARWAELLKGREYSGLEIETATGSQAGVEIVGRVVLARDENTFDVAPSTQTWRLDTDGEWRLVRWTIGVFTTEPIPDDP